MSSTVADEIRWNESSNEWATVYELFRGDEDISVGRIVDWGNANGPNVAVLVGDGRREEHHRVATHAIPETAKRHLLAITSGQPQGSIIEHECAEHARWEELNEVILGWVPGEITIRKEWDLWSLLKGETYALVELKSCPFCGSPLN